MDTISPCHFVIFGATGNLTTIKLLPALYHLERAGRLADALEFIALARRDWSQDDWAEHVQLALQSKLGEAFDGVIAARLIDRFTYVRGDYSQPEAYQALMEVLSRPKSGVCENIIFYLAIRPADFLNVVTHLHNAGFSGKVARHRIVVEKPFGEDLESARMLNMQLHTHFDEEQIYRIDHYLGKETVQNLMVFRFANSLIEPIWNRNYIDHVQITVAEDKGIDSRAGYFDSSGALKDMLQNHMMQLLTVMAMEPPATLDADALQDEKVKVLRSIRTMPREAVNSYAIRAQYSAGTVGNEEAVAYREEENVADDSTTETYVAAKFYIDNWRWKGVPFYLRTGKRLQEKMTSIFIRFKHPPQQLFQNTSLQNIEPNWIVLAIQPHECMHIELHAKEPGLDMNTRRIDLKAPYRDEGEASLDAYETLLLDIIDGDRSLFIRFDEVEWAWQVVDPILRHWAVADSYVHTYPAGSWGPDEATRLFDSDDQNWRNQIEQA
ncbi:glucose-6-phosphate dehydrogenase [Solemya velum gill symbiont]|uniref:glucose-6-phosphate dehydrogenase n=1 Tax=Solemya velum gill symbiont TaxID=2340 RepID=UPI0009967CF8|nr:glucose-6-phosphate dehydrogenase [Solemya velum gill symbiont]OOZ75161.1 glucose-6-phosphate dehydrogenase [Solemya velum gill symbiont]